MTRLRRVIFGAALLGAAASANAQAGADCVPGGTVDQVNACAMRDFRTADTAIGVLYGDVMRALAAHERPQLRREHSAWLKRRSADCKQATRSVEQQPEGPRRFHECLIEQTTARRAGLMRWLSMATPAQP